MAEMGALPCLPVQPRTDAHTHTHTHTRHSSSFSLPSFKSGRHSRGTSGGMFQSCVSVFPPAGSSGLCSTTTCLTPQVAARLDQSEVTVSKGDYWTWIFLLTIDLTSRTNIQSHMDFAVGGESQGRTLETTLLADKHISIYMCNNISCILSSDKKASNGLFPIDFSFHIFLSLERGIHLAGNKMFFQISFSLQIHMRLV